VSKSAGCGFWKLDLYFSLQLVWKAWDDNPTKELSQRGERGRMGVLRSVFDSDERASAAARSLLARYVFNGLRWMVRAGAPWRMIPHDLPPWSAIHPQTMRWVRAGCFEAMAHDLRAIVRHRAPGRGPGGGSHGGDLRAAAPCRPRRKAESGQARMGISDEKVPRCISRWIHSGICWRGKSRRPMSRTARKSAH
jgi:transposase